MLILFILYLSAYDVRTLGAFIEGYPTFDPYNGFIYQNQIPGLNNNAYNNVGKYNHQQYLNENVEDSICELAEKNINEFWRLFDHFRDIKAVAKLKDVLTVLNIFTYLSTKIEQNYELDHILDDILNVIPSIPYNDHVLFDKLVYRSIIGDDVDSQGCVLPCKAKRSSDLEYKIVVQPQLNDKVENIKDVNDIDGYGAQSRKFLTDGFFIPKLKNNIDDIFFPKFKPNPSLVNRQLFSKENLIKMLKAVRKQHAMGKANTKTENLNKILNLLLYFAKKSAFGDKWFEMNFSNTPLEEYVLNLLHQTWLIEIFTKLHQNQYDLSVLQIPSSAYTVLERWVEPKNLVNMIKLDRQRDKVNPAELKDHVLQLPNVKTKLRFLTVQNLIGMLRNIQREENNERYTMTITRKTLLEKLKSIITILLFAARTSTNEDQWYREIIRNPRNSLEVYIKNLLEEEWLYEILFDSGYESVTTVFEKRKIVDVVMLIEFPAEVIKVISSNNDIYSDDTNKVKPIGDDTNIQIDTPTNEEKEWSIQIITNSTHKEKLEPDFYVIDIGPKVNISQDGNSKVKETTTFYIETSTEFINPSQFADNTIIIETHTEGPDLTIKNMTHESKEQDNETLRQALLQLRKFIKLEDNNLPGTMTLFNIGNLLRIVDNLDLIQNKTPLLQKFESVVRYLLNTAAAKPSNDWFKGVIENPQNEIDEYAKKLLLEERLHIIMFGLNNNNFDVNVIERPPFDGIVRSWQLPQVIVTTNTVSPDILRSQILLSPDNLLAILKKLKVKENILPNDKALLNLEKIITVFLIPASKSNGNVNWYKEIINNPTDPLGEYIRKTFETKWFLPALTKLYENNNDFDALINSEAATNLSAWAVPRITIKSVTEHVEQVTVTPSEVQKYDIFKISNLKKLLQLTDLNYNNNLPSNFKQKIRYIITILLNTAEQSNGGENWFIKIINDPKSDLQKYAKILLQMDWIPTMLTQVQNNNINEKLLENDGMMLKLQSLLFPENILKLVPSKYPIVNKNITNEDATVTNTNAAQDAQFIIVTLKNYIENAIPESIINQLRQSATKKSLATIESYLKTKRYSDKTISNVLSHINLQLKEQPTVCTINKGIYEQALQIITPLLNGEK